MRCVRLGSTSFEATLLGRRTVDAPSRQPLMVAVDRCLLSSLMCELAQGCSPLLLPLAARRCCCLELAAAAARRSAAAAEASALGAGAVGVGGCAQLRWSATGMRSVSSELLLRSGSSIWKLAGAARYLDFSPRLRPGRKTKDASRSVTCAAACLGCVSMCRRLWSRAKSRAVLGGTLGPLPETAHSHTSHDRCTRLHFTQ